MYETFYGLREKPFALVPDPDFLFLGRLHGAALNMLEYALRGQASFTLISGEVGCGKTILVRRFLRMIDDASTTVGIVTNTPRAGGHLLERILLAFNLDYRGKSEVEQYETLINFVEEQHTRGRRCVLIVDEAHNLDEDSLEELRMLSNINVDKALALQVILVGQPEILDLLNTRSLRQLVQRISVNFRLLPLTFIETRRYIRHRLRVAGGSADIFEPRAIALVHLMSGGIPRLINIICDAALVYGFGEGRSKIDIGVIETVAADISRGGLATLPGIEDDPLSQSLLEAADELVETLDDEASEEYIELPPLSTGQGKSPPEAADPLHEVEAAAPVGDRNAGVHAGSHRPVESAARHAEVSPPIRTVIPVVDTAATSGRKGRSRLPYLFAIFAIFAGVCGGLAWFYWPAIEKMRVSLAGEFAPTSSLPNMTTPAVGPGTALPPLPEPDNVPALGEPSQLQDGDASKQKAADTEAAQTPPAPAVGQNPVQTLPDANAGNPAASVAADAPVPPAAPENPPATEPVSSPAPAVGPKEATPKNLADTIAATENRAGDFGVALVGLFSRWKQDFQALAGASPCSKANSAELACYERDGNMKRLIRLDRPAVIGLKTGDSGIAYALLTGRDGNNLKLQIDDHNVVATRDEVDGLIAGSFLMLWKPPPGFNGLLVQGRRGEAVTWVRDRLKTWLGKDFDVGSGDVYNAALASAVREFQKRRNLQVDGIVGIETLIEINSATRGDEVPHLQ